MGVYGNIGAFNGLGKPSIKLEFEDNEALVAFSKKMQEDEPAPVQWNEEEEMFTPVEGVRLSEKDFFDALEYNAEPYVYRDFNEQNIISVFGHPKHRKDSFGNVKYAFEINTPLKGSESKVYIWKDMNHALFNNSTKEDRSRFWTMIKPTIERPAIVFEKGGKNHFVKCFESGDGRKVHFTFIPALVNEKNIKTFIVRGKRTQDEIYKIYNDKKGGGSVLKYLVGSNATINGADWLSEPILFVECRLYADKDNSNISDRQTFSEKNSLGAPGDTYIITDTRTRARKDLEDTAAFRKFDVKKVEGGMTSAAAQSDGGVVLIPIFDLNFDTKNFQNREDEYSETSVDRIIDAVADGEFNWAVFDPITVWHNPSDGKIYVLSGHSRSEAFRRLTMQGAQAQGRKFDKIPAKIFDGTFEQARELALNSNTLSTKETDIERANYYRERRAKLMERGGKPSEVRKQLLELARKNEGKNANRIIYLSHLTPRGITHDALKNLQNSGTQDRERMTVAAEWIGHLRYQFPQLTEMHENELYRFLITNGHYGADVRNFADFAKRVQTAIEKNTKWGNFNADKALNMERNLGKSENEKRYDAELARLKKEWQDADDTLTRKLGEFKARQRKDNSISDAQIVAAARPYKDAALIAKANYLAFRDKRGQYLQADDRQMALFGKTANNALYNNLDILDCRGMKPTYKQLPNYDAFFKPAANKISLRGWGLNDTKKLIADICRTNYKECAAIARHLKADTKLQSAFNLWHWLHHNIRYEYDREGREEVRTPARVWADRHRGVDCDCLSVFAWCVLKCMGYNPAFELAAFRNKPAYSHIYINLDGIVVDRVWYVFNSRPPFITKTELFKVGMLDNLGQLF